MILPVGDHLLKNIDLNESGHTFDVIACWKESLFMANIVVNDMCIYDIRIRWPLLGRKNAINDDVEREPHNSVKRSEAGNFSAEVQRMA